MDEETTTSAPAAPAPRPKQLENSVWCLDKSGRLGMIADINAGAALFYYEGENDALETTGTPVSLDQLTRAPAHKLPARLSYTPEQLVDMGYAD